MAITRLKKFRVSENHIVGKKILRPLSIRRSFSYSDGRILRQFPKVTARNTLQFLRVSWPIWVSLVAQ